MSTDLHARDGGSRDIHVTIYRNHTVEVSHKLPYLTLVVKVP